MKLLFPLLFLSFCRCDSVPKRYTVDLDSPARERWKTIVEDHKESLPAVAEESKRYIPSIFQSFVFWMVAKLVHLFPHEYAEELRGISEASGLPLGEIVGLNILYDISAFDRKHIFGLGCTSIVAEDSEGNIFHGRNLDYEMSDLLKNITVIVDFKKNGKIRYTGITFVLYTGLLTGQRPRAFSISLNARYSGAYIDNIFMEFCTHFKNPVSFMIRQVLEEEEHYSSAVQRLSNTPLICPAYIVVAGIKSGEGAIVSRNRLKQSDVFNLNVAKGRWFIVETNFDHWTKQGDSRRKTASHGLRKIGQGNLNADTMYRKVLSRRPILNNLTVFSSVMSAANPDLLYSYTEVRLH